jgi:hypothetical protein
MYSIPIHAVRMFVTSRTFFLAILGMNLAASNNYCTSSHVASELAEPQQKYTHTEIKTSSLEAALDSKVKAVIGHFNEDKAKYSLCILWST